MQGVFELHPAGRNHGCDAGGNKTFHIGGAASIKPVIRIRHDKRIICPVLAINRYNIRMPR